MGLPRRITAIFLILLGLAACDEVNFCYYPDDFGDSGEFDIINLQASEDNCHYNSVNKSIGDNDNETIKKCLKDTSLSSLGKDSSMDMTEYFKFISRINGKPINEAYCSDVDIGDSSLVIEAANSCSYGGIGSSNLTTEASNGECSSGDARANASYIFSVCVDQCQNKCVGGTTSDSSAWTKANIKTSDTYVGIELAKNVYISISVSGSVALDSETTNSELDYKKSGIDEINYNFHTRDGERLNLDIDVNKNSLGVINPQGELSDRLSRSYLDFVKVHEDLIINGFGEELTYKFQKPNFEYFGCEYVLAREEDCENECKYKAVCKFDHSIVEDLDQSTIDILDRYYNNKSNLYSVLIFPDDYYVYASSGMDSVTIADDGVGGISIGDKNGRERNGGEIVFWPDTLLEMVEGYVWNTISSVYMINITRPMKIAIKYIGSKGVPECVFSVEDNRRYRLKEDDKTAEAITVTYDNIKYASKDKKWMTLKTSEGKEIVFNQHSTNSSASSAATIVFSLSKDSNIAGCVKGLAIKLLPFKEYEIPRDGLLFLSTPSLGSEEAVAYTIINKLALEQMGMDLYYRVSEFFEFEDNLESFSNRKTKTLTQNQVRQLNGLNTTEEIFNGTIVDRAIFVRKQQLLRLDYSNWLDIDDKEKIELKYTFLGDKKIGQFLGLSAFIVEKPPYFCFKTAGEPYDVESACSAENGTYGSITVGEGRAVMGACSVLLKECMAGEELVSGLNNVDYRQKSCLSSSDGLTDETKSLANSFAQNLTDFWPRVLSSYKFLKSCTTENKNCGTDVTVFEDCSGGINIGDKYICQNCYDKIIKSTYIKLGECVKKLSSSTSNYIVYRGVVDSHGDEIYREKVENINLKYSTAETIEDMVEVLKNSLFVESSSIEGVDGTTNELFTPHFYYYKNLCSGEQGDGELSCVVMAPQCYSLAGYRGSFSKLIERLKIASASSTNNIASTSMNGHLTEIDIKFGAEKLKSFSGNGGGLIKNFNQYTGNNDEYLSIKYNKSLFPSGNNFIRFFVINDISDSATIFENNLKAFNKIKVFAPNIFKIFIERAGTYKNGERLAVFIGRNDGNYTGNPNKLFYNESTVVKDYSESSDKANSVLHIVKYSAVNNEISTLDKNSKFAFDLQGVLKSTNGGIGVDLSNANYSFPGNDYLSVIGESNSNLFFKLIDTDNLLSNNSGSYQIRIRTVNRNENKIILKFRDFFNVILGFIDGSEVALRQNRGTIVPCPRDGNSSCVVYNEENVSENGNTCVYANDTNSNYCYEDCNGVDVNIVGSCKKYADGRGFVKVVFENFIKDPLYQFVAKILLILMITLYGFGYFFGLTNFTQSEIIPKVIRVCFIYFIISPNGWDFFNGFIIRFFKQGVDSILFLIAGSFETSIDSELSIAVATGNYYDKSVLFSTCFSNIKLIFSDPILNKIFGLAFSSWFGLIYLYLVFTTVINYIIGVFSALIMYLNSQIYMSLVFCFFPLVVLFMFFERTKKTLDNWINLLVGFVGQQLFLIMVLSFFNMLIYNFIKITFSYTVCWLSIFNINIGGIPLALISFWKIPSSNLLGGLNTINEGMPTFYNIMSFYIIGVLMGKFVTGSAELGSNIFGGGVSIAGGMAGMANKVLEAGGEKAKGAMKNLGTGFAKSMANRFGGSTIKNFAEKSKKERAEKAKKKEETFKRIDSLTKDKMNAYRSSEDFKNDLKSKRSADYDGLSEKKKEKMDKKNMKSLLEEKEGSKRAEATREVIADAYGSEIKEDMKKNKEDLAFGGGSEEEKRERMLKRAGEFAEKRGFM
ncbi:MAG: type IV secretion system protein [Rickettsiales bacterium]|nr:type IV secretion system protein [Rickettsiales bacterium]